MVFRLKTDNSGRVYLVKWNQKVMKKSKSTFLLWFGSNSVWMTFFTTHDYLDGFQDDNRQFEEGLLLKWNQKIMKKSKYTFMLQLCWKFCCVKFLAYCDYPNTFQVGNQQFSEVKSENHEKKITNPLSCFHWSQILIASLFGN